MLYPYLYVLRYVRLSEISQGEGKTADWGRLRLQWSTSYKNSGSQFLDTQENLGEVYVKGDTTAGGYHHYCDSMDSSQGP